MCEKTTETKDVLIGHLFTYSRMEEHHSSRFAIS